jgi:hypothetical protein
MIFGMSCAFARHASPDRRTSVAGIARAGAANKAATTTTT